MGIKEFIPSAADSNGQHFYIPLCQSKTKKKERKNTPRTYLVLQHISANFGKTFGGCWRQTELERAVTVSTIANSKVLRLGCDRRLRTASNDFHVYVYLCLPESTSRMMPQAVTRSANPPQKKFNKRKKPPACDSCKARRVLCQPTTDGTACPRCVEKGTKCTTTPVTRGRPPKAHLGMPVVSPTTPLSSASEEPEPRPSTSHPNASPTSPVVSLHSHDPTRFLKLSPELVHHLFECFTHLPQCNHPIFRGSGLRNVLAALLWQIYLLPPQQRVLAHCVVALSASISFDDAGHTPHPSQTALFSPGVRICDPTVYGGLRSTMPCASKPSVSRKRWTLPAGLVERLDAYVAAQHVFGDAQQQQQGQPVDSDSTPSSHTSPGTSHSLFPPPTLAALSFDQFAPVPGAGVAPVMPLAADGSLLGSHTNNNSPFTEAATFAIYSPADGSPQTDDSSLSTDNIVRLQPNLGMGGCLISVHEPVAAAAWIENNWGDPLLTSIQESGCCGPVPFMLFPTKPALALFGVFDDPFLASAAESLAELSGFPVVVRPIGDNPIRTPPHTNSDMGNISHQGNQLGRNNAGEGYRDDLMDGTVAGGSGGGGSAQGGSGDDENGGSDEDEFPHDRQPNKGGKEQDGDGGDDGGDGRGGATAMDNNWTSEVHRTCLKLRLKLNTNDTYAISIGYKFKFQINRETDLPIDLANLNQPLTQSEVIVLVDFKIETRARETQSRSGVQRSGKGLQAGVTAAATAALSYNVNRGSTLEATDSKSMPRCRVAHENGDEWDEENRSYSSYNIAYQPQDMALDAERDELHPLEVKVGMGINLQPPVSTTPFYR
ncbi:hypothetical protein C8R44DRAFT_948151 [Mycena epipterygia]|nr:hypothetical protein C8R44DRAFT_948151 [Mycena epipterygia]